jgi:flagellar hook-basal body complex protein FliE
MNSIDPSAAALLNQMRAMRAEMQALSTSTATGINPGGSINPSTGVKGTGFSELLQNTLSSVSETQASAQDMAVGYETGTSDASLVEVMVALQEADLSFRAVAEVRNKLVAAYQEIMNMPV